MYASETTVRNLCRNRKSQLTTDEIEAAATLVDPTIDAALAGTFYWPEGPNGEDLAVNPPAIITTIAAQLTASWIESQSYAQLEAGGIQANPYGSALRRRGEKALEDLIAGRIIDTTLVRRQFLAQSSAGHAFSPVAGLRRNQTRRTRTWP